MCTKNHYCNPKGRIYSIYSLKEISRGDNTKLEEIMKILVKVMELVTVELMVLTVMKWWWRVWWYFQKSWWTPWLGTPRSIDGDSGYGDGGGSSGDGNGGYGEVKERITVMITVVIKAMIEVKMVVLCGIIVLHLTWSHGELWWLVTRITSNQLFTPGDKGIEEAGIARWKNALWLTVNFTLNSNGEHWTS